VEQLVTQDPEPSWCPGLAEWWQVARQPGTVSSPASCRREREAAPSYSVSIKDTSLQTHEYAHTLKFLFAGIWLPRDAPGWAESTKPETSLASGAGLQRLINLWFYVPLDTK